MGILGESEVDDGISAGGLTERAKQLYSLYTFGNLLYGKGRNLFAKAKEHTTYNVSIQGTDNIYDELHAWLLERLPVRSQRRLFVQTNRVSRRDNECVPDGGDTYGNKYLKLIHAGSRTETIKMDGYDIKVWIERETFSGDSKRGIENSSESFLKNFEKIVFSASSVEGKNAVLKLITKLSKEYSNSGQRFYIANKYGGWNNRSELAKRDPKSVILNDGISDKIINDLDQFLKSEQEYIDLGIPWHRGYLFHGPGGTGKTSFARVLATHFKLDLYYLPLSDIQQDTNLINVISEVDSRSILLLEDIDVVHAAGHRDDAETEGISSAGLLNSLDGVSTPHGLITIMTTNHIEILDPILIRPGRADLIQEFGPIEPENINNFVENFLGDCKPLPYLLAPVTPAEIVGILKANLHAKDKGYSAIVDYIEKKNWEVENDEEN